MTGNHNKELKKLNINLVRIAKALENNNNSDTNLEMAEKIVTGYGRIKR